MSENQLDTEIITEFISLQKAELTVKKDEVAARSAELNNQKEIALVSIDAQKHDREQQRETSERESLRNKLFSVSVLLTILVFIGFLVIKGYAEDVFVLLGELLKYGLAFLGGSGLTIVYFNKKSKEND